MKLSVLRAAAEAPNRIALVAGGVELTYATLADRVAARAADLQRLGSDDAAPRALFTPTLDVDDIVTIHALIELGVPVALLHPRLTDAERRRQREIVGRAINLDAAKPFQPADRSATLEPRVETDPERYLAVLFTSGTTGAPRGVVLSRRAFLSSAAASEANIGRRDDDRWLLCMPLAHVGGLSILTRCLIARTCVVVAPQFDPDVFIETVESSGVTLASLVPTMLRRILGTHPAWRPPSSLRAILLGGSAAPAALIHESADRGLPILTTYGLTETCSQVATQPYGARPSPQWGAGRPLPNIDVRARDGAIHVRGPTLLTRYLGDSREITPLDGDGWFDTGDRGSFDEEGNLHVLGRSAEFIVTGGETVSAREVEEVLESCPGISAACVVGVDDPEWGQTVVAALVEDSAGPPPEAELSAFLAPRLAGFKRPKRFVYLPSLPLTPTGKPDRPALLRLLGSGLD